MKILGPQQSKERTQSTLVILFILFPFLCSPSLTKYFCFFNFSSCSNKVLITCFFFEIAFFATGQPIQNIPIICQIDCCKNHSYFKSSACINIATKMIYPSNCYPSQMAGILRWSEAFATNIVSCNKDQNKKIWIWMFTYSYNLWIGLVSNATTTKTGKKLLRWTFYNEFLVLSILLQSNL